MSKSQPNQNKSSRLPSWLGAYGAIVATLAFSWNIFQYLDSRPRLDVQITSYGSILGVGENTLVPEGHFVGTNPLIRFVNKGSKPLTVYFLQIDFRPTSTPKEITHLPAYSSVIGEPLKLDAGDAKDWKPVLLSSPSPTAIEKTKMVLVTGKLRLLALTTAGKYEQQSEIQLAYPISVQ
jgi:hypothetical protein